MQPIGDTAFLALSPIESEIGRCQHSEHRDGVTTFKAHILQRCNKTVAVPYSKYKLTTLGSGEDQLACRAP